MITDRVSRSCLMAWVMTVTFVCSSFAQTPRSAGPYSGLFGGRSSTEHTLDLRAGLFGAYQETDTPEDAANPETIDRVFTENGLYSGASASLSYAFDRSAEESQSRLYAAARGTLSHTSVLPDDWPFLVSGSAGASTRLTQRIGFDAYGNTYYSPYYNFRSVEQGYSPEAGFGNQPSVGPSFGGAATNQPTFGLGAGASLIADLTRRSTLSLNADWFTQRLLRSSLNDSTTYNGQLMYRYSLTEHFGVHAGVGRLVTTTSVPDAARGVNETIDAGVDYGDDIPLGRRTTLTFSTSTGFIRYSGESRFRLNGNVNVAQGIGRTWSVSAHYTRDVSYLAGFQAPMLSDTVGGRLDGQVAPRLSWNSDIAWERGEFWYEDQQYRRLSVGSSLNFAISESFSLYVQYSDFHYEIPPGSTSLPLYQNYSRQIVSAGLTTWLPILQRGRTPRDSR